MTLARTGCQRVLALLIAALAATVVHTTPAQAGSYTVHECDAGTGYRVNAIAYGANGLNNAYSACPVDGGGHRIGILAVSGLNAGTSGWLTASWANFYAPGGTTITNVSGHISGRTLNGYGSSLQASSNNFASSTVLVDCAGSYCPLLQPDGGIPINLGTPGGTTALRLLTICGNGGGCPTSSAGGWPYAPGWTSMGDMHVTIDDPYAPNVANGRGSAWNAGAWHRGTESIGFDANDTGGGIARMYVAVDGGLTADSYPGCDYTYARPCSDRSLDSSIDTTNYSDGYHTVTLAAMDAGGNWRDTGAVALNVDNHAPARPDAPTVAGGESTWHTTNSFNVSWTNPGGQVAPITQAHYTIYDDQGNAVAAGTRSASGISSLSGIGVPAPGDYTIKTYLEDAAGNTNSATASDPVHLKFDNLAPGQAEPQRANGWVNAQDILDYPEPIRLQNGAFRPVSGIAGYSVTTDGSAPDDTIEITSDTADPAGSAPYRIADLPEGVNTIRARAVSGAGIGSTDVGTTIVKVDKSPPAPNVDDAPDPAEWQRQAVPLTFSGSDQPTLSGMTGADSQQPVEEGAYVTYRVDGGPVQKVRGASAALTVADDGVHTINYQAFDLAGNPSVEKTVRVKVDRTAPETVVFQAPDKADPTMLTVRANDRTSGVAGGAVIQVSRLLGPGGGLFGKRASGPRNADAGGWQDLPTSQDGGRLTARIDDTQLRGTYLVRAVVKDNAGNVTVGDRWEDNGAQAIIDTTKLRSGADLRAGLVVPAGSCIVPDVNKKALKAARKAITERHCKVGRVSKPKRVRRGYHLVVAKQSPGRGKRLARGGKVALRLRAVRTRHKAASRKRIAATIALKPPSSSYAKRCKKPRTKKHKAWCKKHRPVNQAPAASGPAEGSLVPELVVPFGKTAPARGTLKDASGQPIANAALDVTAKLRVQGADYTPVGAVKTDADGNFAYTVPAGPSRALRFAYAGDQLRRPTYAEITVGVPAATTIKASRRKLRVGQTLKLSGKLKTLGAPVPDAGKLIDLQAFDRGKWRKFATVRTKRDGAWKFKYRFEVTHGLVTYPMRAVVRREAAYAFDTGNSRTVKVRVRGR